MQPDLSKPWEKWYLMAVQTSNILIDISLKEQSKEHFVFENKNVWKIYLAMDYNEGIFRSSSICHFNKNDMSIKTKKGKCL